MSVEDWFQNLHIVRAADEDRVVIPLPVPQEWLEQRRSIADHEFDFLRHVAVDGRPVFPEHRKWIERDETPLFEKGKKNSSGSRKPRAQPGMRNAIVDKEDARL